MERSDAGSKKCKGNEVNSNILRFSCVSWMEDGNIPEWLLVELLVRLPVKSVFRFKLVSTKWLSLISDPYFVRLYVSRASLLSQQPWTIIPYRMPRKNTEFSHLDYELLKDLYVKPSLCAVRVSSIHQSQENKSYTIFGASNDLVLGRYKCAPCAPYGYAVCNYYICNPLTGHCIVLPPLACWLQWSGWGFHTHVEEGLLKSYTVVQFEPPSRASDRPKFHVYASEIGKWKDFTVPCDKFPLSIQKAAVVLDGILHWINLEHGIIAYDPYQNPESMRLIALPNDIGRQDRCSCLCVEYRGKLRYFKLGITSGVAFPNLKVWVLNGYSSGDWCLQHNISHVNVAKYPSTISLMCSHPFDSDIVYLGYDCCCISYNIKTREVHVEDEFFRHSENVLKEMPYWWEFSYSFVIPHWPTSIPRPSHGAVEG